MRVSGRSGRNADRGDEPETGLGDLVHRLLAAHPAFSANPIGDWAEIAGVQVAHHSAPKELKDGRLLVICHDPIWRHHLEMMREALLDRINQGRDPPLVTRIDFRIGELPDADRPLNPNHRLLDRRAPKRGRRGRAKIRPRPLTEAEKELIGRLPDRELRVLARRILSRTPPAE